jgi:hypothetical protein
MHTLAPRLVERLLLIPRVQYWPEHGWRAEVVVDDGKGGDIRIGPFVATRAEAHKRALASLNDWPSREP